MSAKDFKQHMLNELRELERLIRNDCGRDNGLGTSYEPEELKWFEKLHELQELCEGNNIDASDSKLPLCGVSNSVCQHQKRQWIPELEKDLCLICGELIQQTDC